MSISLVQQATGAWASGTTYTVTLSTAPVNGNALALCHGGSVTGTTIVSISQTGATWVKGTSVATNRETEIWYALNVSGAGTVITVTLSSSSAGAASANAQEYSGVDTASALSGTSTGNGNSTTPATGSATPTAGRAAVAIASTRVGGTLSAGPSNGFTALTSPDSLRNYDAYLIIASTSGSYSTDYVAGTGLWASCIVVLLGPVGGSSKVFGRSSLDGLSSSGPGQFRRSE